MKNRLNWVDAVLCAMVVSATIVYLTAFPLHLSLSAEESRQLHEAKRIFDGDVMYRDVVDLILPGWMYLLALCYSLFGATLATARTTIAVVHGITGGLLFLICRRFAVRREIACTAPMAYLVISQPAFPIANQHWLATSLSVLLLSVCLLRWERLAQRAFIMGAVTGLLITVMQHRGACMGIGAAVFLTIEALLSRRYERPLGISLLRQLTFLAAGTVAVVGPTLAWLVLRAGFVNLWRAVVVFPLVNYVILNVPWGSGGGRTLTLPRLIKILPLLLALPILRFFVLWFTIREWERVRALAALCVLSLFAVVSISYLPDFIHIALITPFFFIILAEELESVLRSLSLRAQSVAGWVVALSILGPGVIRLHQNLAHARQVRTTAYESAFGRVDIGPLAIRFYTKLDELLRDVPDRMLYVHPNPRYVYLLTGARNPTRFEFMLLGYHGNDEIQEIVDTLAKTAPPYVLVRPNLVVPGDPVFDLIQARYEPLKGWPPWAKLWRLRPPADSPASLPRIR